MVGGGDPRTSGDGLRQHGQGIREVRGQGRAAWGCSEIEAALAGDRSDRHRIFSRRAQGAAHGGADGKGRRQGGARADPQEPAGDGQAIGGLLRVLRKKRLSRKPSGAGAVEDRSVAEVSSGTHAAPYEAGEGDQEFVSW